jgi:hypothetical protein
MQIDIRLRYEETLDASHHGRPTIIQTIRTGGRGRPQIHIDPTFLEWAYAHRSTSGISRFLHVGRNTVRRALIDYGITEVQENPFRTSEAADGEEDPAGDLLQQDDLLDPNDTSLLTNFQTPPDLSDPRSPSVMSFTGPLSTLSDDDLDVLITQLRSNFHRAGLSMLDGMLRHLGHRLPRERIRASLMRIDPVQRVFQRIRIRRRVYSVPGPNSLWHHDGQHGECCLNIFFPFIYA